jgi:DNA invertase Pin-like site-specific DNA recombinase
MRNERQVRRQRGTQISNVVTPTKTSRIRCAIYTRKSTEEGLDQAFNSLDAQREACAAYILSQRHEGWVGVPDLYDDGGYSGGTMERPALKRLLADVEAGRVDVIVVYKVDRLTRALSSRTLRRSLMSLMRSM